MVRETKGTGKGCDSCGDEITGYGNWVWLEGRKYRQRVWLLRGWSNGVRPGCWERSLSLQARSK